MRKIFGVLSAVGLGVAAMLVPTTASALCSAPVFFASGYAGDCAGGAYCYVTSPGGNTTATIQGTFWGLGGGDPAIGAGDDSGSTGIAEWLLNYGYGGGYSIYGSWAALANTDGCIDNEGTSGKQVVQFTDTDASGSTAYFAAACVTRDPTVTYEFNYGHAGQNIALKALPKAAITNSVRSGNEAQITVASPDFSSLYYSDGSAGCAIGSVIPSYDVWMNQVGRDAPAPTGRATSAGWSLGGTCNVGSPCVVTTACGTTNCDVYLAVSPHYDSNFQTPVVGANSIRVQAGPTIANPPNFKIIHRSPKEKATGRIGN